MRNPWLDLPTEGDERLYKAAVSFLKGMATMGHTIMARTVAAGMRHSMAHRYARQSDEHKTVFERCWREITGEAYPWREAGDVRLEGPWDDLPHAHYDKAAAILHLKRRHLRLSHPFDQDLARFVDRYCSSGPAHPEAFVKLHREITGKDWPGRSGGQCEPGHRDCRIVRSRSR